MEKIKICFVAQFPPPINGLSKAVETLYRSFLNEQFEFERIDITNNMNILRNFKRIFVSNADLFYFTISQSKMGNLRDLIILFLIIIIKHKKCMIHLHGGYYRKMVDCELPKWQKWINYRVVKKLDGAIVLSDSLRDIFKDMLPEDKIFTIPNCVDDELPLDVEGINEKIKLYKDKKIKNILYLSNLIESKGFPLVLEMALLEKKRVDNGAKRRFHFNFAGDFLVKKDKRYFENFVNQYCLHDFVTYYGIVVGTEKKNLLKKSDIFILLSRKEGQPISILEAMSNGLFIITSNAGGIPDIVEDGINGFVEDINRAFSVSTVYEKLLADNNFERIVRNNWEEYRVKYRESMYINNLRGLFEIVVKDQISQMADRRNDQCE